MNDSEQLEEWGGWSEENQTVWRQGTEKRSSEGGNERKRMKKKEGERPGSHVKVITQTQALTHFSEREALPPHLSSSASSLFLTFEKGASRKAGNRNSKG